MSAADLAAAARASDVITLRKSDRGRMATGGTVSHEVYLDGRWIGWVGDARRFTGIGFGGRRWWACHRQDGDTAARWNSEGHGSRKAALQALIARVQH